MHSFLGGVATMGFLVAAVFFLRFWRETRDRLFLLFSIAFAALGLNRMLFAVLDLGPESQPFLYLVRFGAFLLIAWAVVDKNRR
jgi:hypothetical protein